MFDCLNVFPKGVLFGMSKVEKDAIKRFVLKSKQILTGNKAVSINK